jgi:GNAT superfamily N-acetyltransferase
MKRSSFLPLILPSAPEETSSMVKNPSSVPRPPASGPRDERARVAVTSDAGVLVDLTLAAFRDSATPHREDLVRWVVQAVLHDPLRGVYVIAEAPGKTGPKAVGFAAFESLASAEHGWMARLACLYVIPEHRRRGIGSWLLDEALEAARYYGLNHVVFETGRKDDAMRPALSRAGFQAGDLTHFSIDLPPLFDDE